MQAIIYIVQAVLQYLLVAAFLLRLVLPLIRANMRNQISQAVLRVTNPLVMPLRKVLPPVGRVDTASIVALLLVQIATTALILFLSGADPTNWLLVLWKASFDLVKMILELYRIAMFIYVLLSWIAPHTYSPATDVLSSLCEPPLRWMRRLIPPIGGLDLSPVFVLIALSALLIWLPTLFSMGR
ncbi:MAG TPA: YggT family protein [Steroidobacteraceae bacterium]|nr:YggT family protein [Steroidobacteraceae bacterium]